MSSQVIDKGRIVVAVDQFPEKVNGQVVMVQGTNQPKMKNKWMAVGEVTKWQHQDGGISETRKIYLQPVSVSGAFYEEKTFWDSESNQNQAAPQQTGGYQGQHQGHQQQGGYRG
jgi:hypothetical protein